MKVKSILMAICSLAFAGALFTATNTMQVTNPVTISAKADATDISGNVTISGWSDSAELKLLTISFGSDVLSNFDYNAMDTEEFAYIQDYLLFNGKTVKEINADESLGALNWEYTQFPGNASDKYKVPVLIYERDAQRLRLYIHESYLETLGDSVTFEIKAGLEFVNDAGATSVIGTSKTFVLKGNTWEQSNPKSDITENVTINGWDKTGSAGELTYTRINFGEGVLPSDLGYHILDSDIGTQYHYMKDYITVNGKTVGEINAETDVSNYVFSSFPSTAADKYKLPIILFGNGNNLEVKIHNDYVATLGETVEIGVKAGFYVDGASVRYTVSKDVAVLVKGVLETDITANVTIDGWDLTGDAKELTYTRIKFGAGVLPETIDYGIMDSSAYKYLQEYITINGRTVADINTNTDVSSYVFSTFPSTAADVYKVPVMIFENGGTLEIKVHNTYLATLGESAAIVVGVKSGAYIENGSTTYKVTQDVTKTVREEVIISDITENVTIGGWKLAGDLSELTRTIVNFGEGVLPAGIDYGMMDNAKYGYMLDYFTINGKTIREINATTDVSSYVFHTFPSTAADKYKLPVIVFVDGDDVEIKIHNDYLASIGGNIDVIVGVKAGLSIVNGNTTYTISQDVQEYARRKAYTLTVELGLGFDEQYLTMGSEISLTAPERAGYIFEGWFEKDTDNAILSVMPERDYAVYAKYTAIEYTITFMDGETVVGTDTYTLDDTDITIPELPVKEGFEGAWESFALTGGDIVVNAVYVPVETEDSSSDDVSSDDTSEDVSVESSDEVSSDVSEDDSSDIVESSDDISSEEDTTSASDSSKKEKRGCFGTISGASVAMLGLCAMVILKKKENE